MKPKQIIPRIDYRERFKIIPRRNASKKHEIIKTLIVLEIRERFRSNPYWINVETEKELTNNKGKNKTTDVYLENTKEKEIICYEIQKNISEKWKKETADFYNNYDKLFFKGVDWIVIKEKELSDSINELSKQIKELVV